MRIFISYSSGERAEALAIQAWLEDNGWSNEVFVDVDPQHGLTGGEAWRAALRNAAGRCEAVLLLLSRAWLASKPCWSEFQLAEKFKKPCIPIRIDDAISVDDLPKEISNNYQVIDKVAAPSTDFEIRLKRALEAAGAGPANFPLPQGRPPYPGLEALKETDAALLFGRDADVLSALEMLRDIRSTGTKRILALLGASGAGKSSLMRAGIWPRLNRDDRNFIALPTVRPANAILSGKEGLWQSLQTALADPRRTNHFSPNAPRTRAAIRLAAENDFNTLTTLFADIRQAVQKSFVEPSAIPSIVLLIDQAEELFNLEGAAEAEQFFRLLAPVWAADPEFITLIAIRSDVYPHLQTDSRIDQQQIRLLSLAPMSQAGLAQVIEGPARRVGLQVDPALTAALLRDSRGADALPLLAFTLARLFEDRLQDKRLGLNDYTRMGGVRGAIEAAAGKARTSAIAAGVSAQELDTLLRRTFLPHLVRVNEAGEFARRVSDLSEIGPDCLPLVDVLIVERLLIADQRGHAKTVEIAHEAILREWPLLRGWLDAERSFLEWLDQIGRARKLHESDEGDLLAGRALLVAQGFLETRRDAIREIDRIFIEKSITEENERVKKVEADREARRQAELNAAKMREEAALAAAASEKKLADAARQTTTKVRRFAAVMTLLSVVAVITGYYAYVNGENAKAQAIRANTAAENAKEALNKADAAAQHATEEAKRAKAESDRASTAEWAAKSSAMESESRSIALTAEALRTTAGDDKALSLAWLALPHDAAMKERPLTNEAASAIYSRNAQLIDTLKNPISTAVHEDGDVAVTVFSDGRGELWETRTRRVLREFVDLNTDFSAADDDDKPKGAITYTDGCQQGSLPICFVAGRQGIVTLHKGDIVRVWDLNSPTSGPKIEMSLPLKGIKQASVSPDGSILLGIRNDGYGIVWNLLSGKELLSIKDRKLIGGKFSESGSHLFANSDINSGSVWRLTDGREAFRIPEPKGDRSGYYDWHGTGDPQFNLQSNRLLLTTAARDRDSYLWDMKAGRSIAKLVTDKGESGYGDAYIFRFIDDGKLVLIGATSWGTAWTWNAATGKLVRAVKGYASVVRKEGKDRFLRLVDGKAVITDLDGHDELRFGRDFNINKTSDMQINFETGLALAGGRQATEGPLELWDMKADLLLASVGRISSDGEGPGFQFSPDGSQIVTEDEQGIARLWNGKTGALQATLQKQDDNLQTQEARFSLDGGTVLVDLKDSTESGLKIAQTQVWALKSGRRLPLRSSARSAKFSPDGSRILISAEDHSAKIWLANGKTVVADLRGHTGTVVDSAFSSDGSLAITGAWDNTAKIWDSATGSLKTTLQGHASGVAQVALSPDGKLALTGSHDATAKLWTVQSGALIATFEGHKGSIVAASFSPDGTKILTASTDETAAIWETGTGKRLAALAAHTGAVTKARFSPDGARVATASEDHTAMIWDVASGSRLATLEAHGGMVNDVQWSPDGATILTVSSDKTGILWDATNFKVRLKFKGHLGEVTRAVFSPDGKQVATISEDRTFRLWDTETAMQLATHSAHEKTIHSLAFSPNGRLLATASSDGTAGLWTIFPGSLKERIADAGKAIENSPSLTKDECEQYGVSGFAGAEIACAADDGTDQTDEQSAKGDKVH